MRFHWPSFVAGYAAGAVSTVAWARVRPLAVEVVAAGYRAMSAVAARVVMMREDAEDFFAEARARAEAVEEPMVH